MRAFSSQIIRSSSIRKFTLFTIALAAAVVAPMISIPMPTLAVTDCSPNSIVSGGGASSWLTSLGGGVNVCTAGNDSENYINNINGVSTLSGLKWECVELVNRLYLTKGWTTANWSGNGNSLVSNLPSGLTAEYNGGISRVAAGDVITLNGFTYGHAAIIDSGSSTINIINQNTLSLTSTASVTAGSFAAGSATFSMSGWSGYSVQSIIHHVPDWGGVGSPAYNDGSTLASGATLYQGHYLTSGNVQYALDFQASDRNLVIYNKNSIWALGSGGSNAYYMTMQTDGNLVMHRADNSLVWYSGTGGHPGAYAVMQDDGNFVIYTSGGSPLWQTYTGGHPTLTYDGYNNITAGGSMYQNHYERSLDGRYAILMQSNGEAVLYGPGYHRLWSTNTIGHGDTFTMQTDDNLVLYSIGSAYWWSATSGSDYYFVLQNDGNGVVYNSSNVAQWPSGTGGQI